MAGRRLSIVARLVRLGFITEDRATPNNPAVQVLSELLPPDAELGLCLICHGFSSSAPYPLLRRGHLPQRRELPDEPKPGSGFASRASVADRTAQRARGVHAGRAELDRIARASDRQDVVDARMSSRCTRLHLARLSAPPCATAAKASSRCGSKTVRHCASAWRRRPPTRCRRMSTMRHRRSNRRRCPRQTQFAQEPTERLKPARFRADREG